MIVENKCSVPVHTLAKERKNSNQVSLYEKCNITPFVWKYAQATMCSKLHHYQRRTLKLLIFQPIPCYPHFPNTEIFLLPPN